MIATNLRRLMARHGWTVQSLSEAADVDIRTIKSLLAGRQRPHAGTLHKLAEGLGVTADEFFQPIADGDRSAAHAFDRATNPVAAAALAAQPERFADWTAGEIDELFSRVGTGGELNEAGVAEAVRRIESRREVLEKAAVVLETDQAELLERFVEMLFDQVTDLE